MVIRQMVFSSERAACPRTPSPHPPHTATLTSCRRMDLALRLLRGDPDSSSDPVTRISCSTPDSPGHKRAGPRGEGLPASDWVGVPEARLRTCEHDFSRPGGPRSDETWGLHLLSCSSRLRKGRLSDGSAAPTDTRPAGRGRIAPFSLVVKCLVRQGLQPSARDDPKRQKRKSRYDVHFPANSRVSSLFPLVNTRHHVPTRHPSSLTRHHPAPASTTATAPPRTPSRRQRASVPFPPLRRSAQRSRPRAP